MNCIEHEKKIVELMVRLYCGRCHHSGKDLCLECRQLLDYACNRLEKCKFGECKPTCKKCPIHCYAPFMREKIRVVMRYAGSRMVFYHPVVAFRHLFH